MYAFQEFRLARRDLTYVKGKKKRIQKSIKEEKSKLRDRPNVKTLRQEWREKNQKHLIKVDPVAGSCQPIILGDDGTAKIMGKVQKKKKLTKK